MHRVYSDEQGDGADTFKAGQPVSTDGLDHGTLRTSTHQVEDDSDWEDLPEQNLTRSGKPIPTFSRPSTPSSPKGSPVTRNKGKKAFNASSSHLRKLPAKSRNIEKDTTPLINIDANKFKGAVATGASESASYAYDIFRTVALWSKHPLAFLIWLLLFAVVFSKVWNVLRLAFAPLCLFPGVSGLVICQVPQLKEPQWADYPSFMEMQSRTFEQLLEEVAGGTSLSLEVKMAEMAVKDLGVLVKVSDLPSKDRLATTLEQFCDDAKMASRSLSKWGSKVNGAIDSLVAVHDHALHTIERKLNESQSALSVLWPFSSELGVRRVVVRSFTEAMSLLDVHIKRVLLEAEINLSLLERLDARLNTLNEILEREGNDVTAERDKILSSLWKKLGGYRKELAGLGGHLFLLENIGQYRKQSLAHVTAAMHVLQQMADEMEDIRERVATPQLTGDKIPIEVHLKSIRSGLDRLSEKSLRSLETQRGSVKKLFNGS